ncbi:MAG: MmcQ/YjbR family DNA-binding protein [Saprospiraceae bacterium]|nr:MmcQ/YjbR family DNA-binding protein [Saprospiraceae bacterium]MBL0100956.1 MmcQ/YjbR family DNA-binding protein [Saprospiraceae bacterium]
MDIQEFTEYCLAKKGVTESFPFGGDTLVFKVVGKMFALTGLDEIPSKANLKCDPEWGVTLREEYEDITPGYHMNKVHWNTILLEGQLENAFIKKLIDHSYQLVVNSLTKRDKAMLDEM